VLYNKWKHHTYILYFTFISGVLKLNGRFKLLNMMSILKCFSWSNFIFFEIYYCYYYYMIGIQNSLIYNFMNLQIIKFFYFQIKNKKKIICNLVANEILIYRSCLLIWITRLNFKMQVINVKYGMSCVI
jgi:hypothetical protein